MTGDIQLRLFRPSTGSFVTVTLVENFRPEPKDHAGRVDWHNQIDEIAGLELEDSTWDGWTDYAYRWISKERQAREAAFEEFDA